jgi:hypothetical protein
LKVRKVKDASDVTAAGLSVNTVGELAFPRATHEGIDIHWRRTVSGTN